MNDQFDALEKILSQALDVVKTLKQYNRGEGDLGVGVKSATVEPQRSEILITSIKEKKIQKKEKFCESESFPKIECPYSTHKDPKIKCTDPSCQFGEFWAVYPIQSGKRRAHVIFKRLTQRCSSLADEIISDVVTRKLKHVKWINPKFIPHASTHLNGRHWEDPIIEGEQHDRSPYQQAKSTAKVYPIESYPERIKQQREAIRAAQRKESEKIIN